MKLDLLVVYLHVVGCCCVWIRRITDAFTLGKRHFIYLTVVRLIVYRQLIGLRDEQNWSTELNFRKVCRKVRGKVTIQHLFHSIPNFRYAITKKRWAPFYLKQIWPFDFEFSSSFTLQNRLKLGLQEMNKARKRSKYCRGLSNQPNWFTLCKGRFFFSLSKCKC